MVWPRSVVDGSENAHSIELVGEWDDATRSLSVLLTGDAERDETGAVIEAGDVGDIDLLKVGHHGSEVSLTPEQAQSLSAEVAVASAGEHNSYGHPTEECVSILEESGSLFLCTKDAGDVELRPGREGPLVLTQRPIEAIDSG
jgi:competence protein ComEC